MRESILWSNLGHEYAKETLKGYCPPFHAWVIIIRAAFVPTLITVNVVIRIAMATVLSTSGSVTVAINVLAVREKTYENNVSTV